MDSRMIIFLVIFSLNEMACGYTLPTLYEYYSEGGIKSSLEAPESGFKLNGKDITIFSGAIHYFRVHPNCWRDRLRKLRAAGLNTVETYIPWNLHEPYKGEFDFGNGKSFLSKFLDVRRFIKTAQEEDLLVIIRPGPYICTEWEFGGLPSWLLRTPNISVRTSDPNFTERVKIYFDNLLPQLVDLQFIRGGSIIIAQIENEYGDFGDKSHPRDKEYLRFIKKRFEENGLEGLFTTCDTPGSVGDIGALHDVLQTATFSKDPEFQLQALKKLQPNRALMVMEYWSGWYDHWLDENHQTGLSNAEFEDTLKKILNLNASVNIYMFFGGTDFGFMNGADPLSSSPYYAYDASSYDYAAPLSEAGDYTEKYSIVENIVSEYNTVKTKLPEKPKESKKYAYPSIPIAFYLTGEDIISRIDAKDKVKETTVQSMESLNINNLNGQSYGYINYRKRVNLTTDSRLKIIGHPRDIVMLMLDGDQKTNILSGATDLTGFGYWVNGDQEFAFNEADAGDHQLDLLVENWGRCNYGYPKDFDQRKGLWEGPILIDGIEQKGWEITAVQFQKEWIDSLQGWRNINEKAVEKGPVLLKGTFEVDEETSDTWIDMSNWGKGVVFINGFNIGRYLYLGPPTSLYIPSPLLSKGTNEVVIFEQYKPALEVTFSNKPTYRNVTNKTIQGSI